jgi:hypothetical protein
MSTLSKNLDCVASAMARNRLIASVDAALAAEGMEAVVSLIAAQPVSIPARPPHGILGSRRGACAPAVGIVLKPISGRRATGREWARTAAGESAVRLAVARWIPAHVAVRVLYDVAHPRHRQPPTDPPLLGRGRLGHTYLEKRMKNRNRTTLDALTQEILSDIHELFGVSITPESHPHDYNEFITRCRRRHEAGCEDGQLISASLLNDILDRIGALERLVAERARFPIVHRGKRRTADLPLNPDPNRGQP